MPWNFQDLCRRVLIFFACVCYVVVGVCAVLHVQSYRLQSHSRTSMSDSDLPEIVL